MKKVSAEVLNLDVEKLIEMLNAALCEEWLAYYQYWVGARIMEGPMRIPIEAELLEHANEELKHAEMLIERIIQLGGTPVLNPLQWQVRNPDRSLHRDDSRAEPAQRALRDQTLPGHRRLHQRRGLHDGENGGGYSRGRARTRERYRFVPGRHRRDERRDRKNGEIARAVYRRVIEASGRPIGPP